MITSHVTEVRVRLEPVSPDPFVQDLESTVRPPAPTRAPAPHRPAERAAKENDG